jgi:hypothetical protein
MEKVNTKRLFIASCLALLVTAITFAIRAKIEGVFTDDYGLTKEEVGRAFGPAFWVLLSPCLREDTSLIL